DPAKLMGVGISMPGLVSAEEGKNFTYFISDEEPESLQEVLSNKFGKPVYILNDAKSACLAEFRFGLARRKKNVLVISMDWGVGLGITIDGKCNRELQVLPENSGISPWWKTGCSATAVREAAWKP